MAKVVFYEKPGCGGNARQKSLLAASGHELDVRNLLTESWTAETLRPFFGSRPVTAWFNMAAPQVKSGEVDPGTFTEEEALAAMSGEALTPGRVTPRGTGIWHGRCRPAERAANRRR